jgi:hypothetical protein
MTASPEPKQWQPPQYLLAGRGYSWVDNNPPMVSLENMILYTETISSVPKTWIYKPDDYVGPDTVAVEQSDIGQRVVIDSSLRSAYIGIWTTSYQVSPEQFVVVTLAPGERAEFTRTYKFSADGTMWKDITGDKAINAGDLSALSAAWLTTPGGPSWNPSCDISNPGDDVIDNRDLASLGQVWRRDADGPAPVAHWPLDETTGLIAGDIAGSHDGSLIGFAADDSQWATGHSAGGLEFDGTDDYVEVTDFPSVCGKDARAVFAWIKTQAVAGSRLPIIAWGQNQPGAYWLIEVDEDRRLRLSCGSGFISANEQQIGDGTWHHVAVVLDPVDRGRPLISDVLLYVDGRRRTIYKMQEADIDTAGTANVRIGASHDLDAGTFVGIIDELLIFDATVDATAVRRAHIQ